MLKKSQVYKDNRLGYDVGTTNTALKIKKKIDDWGNGLGIFASLIDLEYC